MVSSTFISATSVLLALVFWSGFAQAAPWPAYTKHSTHRRRIIGRGVHVEAYHPKTTYKTYGATGSSNIAARASKRLNESAISFVSSELGIDADKIAWRGGWSNNVAQYAFVKEAHDGIPFANAVANVAFHPETSKPVSFGSSFIDTTTAKIADSKPSLTWRSVLPAVEEQLDGKHNDIEPSLEYYVKSDGSVALTHVIQLQNEETDAFYEAYVCAHSGELVSVTDFVAHASYTVVPINKKAFPNGLETLKDPQDLLASPFGWHNDGQTNTTVTSGNNVVAFRGRTTTAQSSAGLNFNAAYDDTNQPTNRNNIAGAVTNAFYIINTMHDFTYRYGFTENSFNFQASNFDKNGRGNDQVMISVQDGSGTNNANFATPPDGQNGVCRMFVWTLTNPNRDGALENSIVIHEFTHGITNRMTGGGTGRCLQTVESGGLGEGWGDAMAELLALNSATVSDFTMGEYVLGSNAGIRSFPYSTNAQTNPLRYSSLQQLNEVHEIGEVWANMLHNVLAALVAEHGFSADLLTNPDGTEGNIVYMHLFMDSLGLQPCNPTFVQARDAWIQADQNRYNGANKCLLSKAFASRGLGARASGNFRDDTSVLAGC